LLRVLLLLHLLLQCLMLYAARVFVAGVKAWYRTWSPRSMNVLTCAALTVCVAEPFKVA
jgi:hypothetical protein